MSTNLDRFSPEAWQENGILKVANLRRTPFNGQRRAVTPLVTAMAISLAWVCATPPSALLARSFSSMSRPTLQEEQPGAPKQTAPPQSGDFISPSSWPKLMAMIKAAPDVEDVDGEEPEPMF